MTKRKKKNVIVAKNSKADITTRKADVAALRLKGYSFREIGNQTGISRMTACRDWAKICNIVPMDDIKQKMINLAADNALKGMALTNKYLEDHKDVKLKHYEILTIDSIIRTGQKIMTRLSGELVDEKGGEVNPLKSLMAQLYANRKPLED